MLATMLRPALERLHRSVTSSIARGVTIGLLGAIAMLLAALVSHDHRQLESAVTRAAAHDRPHDVVIDVSRHAAGDRVVELIGLARGERVIAIDDRPATSDEVVDAWRLTAPGQFLDLTVAGVSTPRRVLLLVHP